MVKILKGPHLFPRDNTKQQAPTIQPKNENAVRPLLGADSIPATTAATNFPRRRGPTSTRAPLIIVSFTPALLPVFPWLWFMSDRMGTFYDGLVTVDPLLLHISPHSPLAVSPRLRTEASHAIHKPDAAARSYNNKHWRSKNCVIGSCKTIDTR